MIAPLKLSDFEHSTIAFEAHKLLDSQVAWVNQKSNFVKRLNKPSDGGDRQFHQRFSYVIKTNTCFSHSQLDQHDKVIMLGERYGGSGIGSNGGGVRCGNIGGYQIKGIGTNDLVGKDTHQSHSYGGLDLHSAIIETIYSNVLNLVLPIGAVNVVGLLYTGLHSALRNGQVCAGALLVRETCLRPAHFLKAPNHKPSVDNKYNYFSDSYRTKRVNHQLKLHFVNDKAFVMYLGRFLSNCANQFAFAKVMGIGHRTVSPSNIAFDGKWLDVPLASFVGGGVNFVARRPIYEEHFVAIEIADELVHSYSKYNATALNVQPLINYYLEQLQAYYDRYFAHLLSLPNEFKRGKADKDWTLLLDTFDFIMAKSQVVIYSQGALTKNSPALEFIIALYTSFFNKKSFLLHVKKHFDIDVHKSDKLRTAFLKVLRSVYKKRKDNLRFDAFVFNSAIMAIKKSSQLRFFHINNGLEKSVELVSQAPTKSNIAGIINDYQVASEWIFEGDNHNQIILFKSSTLTIAYKKREKCFHTIDNKQLVFHRTITSFLLHISTIDESILTLHHFSFKPSLLNLRCLQSNTEEL